MKVLIKSAWDPTNLQSCLCLPPCNAFAEAGHEVQIFLLVRQ